MRFDMAKSESASSSISRQSRLLLMKVFRT